MISFSEKGDFKKTRKWLEKSSKLDLEKILDKYGKLGVEALSSATPKDSGETANSWGYEISTGSKSSSITWTNSNIENGFPVAIMLQYGHGTGNGGYVSGRDYINPAIRDIFESLAKEAWREVTR